MKLPPIGQGSTFGGKKYPDNRQRKLATLEQGFEAGLNLVDTGEYYEGGVAEEVVGQFIKGKRPQVIVSDKFKAANNDKVIQSCEASLKRLQTDYIDLYQIQWPNYEIPLSTTLRQLETLKRQGKVREIGVCNFTLNELKQAGVKYLQTEFNLQNRVLLDTQKVYDCTYFGYNIFNQGFLGAPEYIKPIAQKYGKTPNQIILAWAISKCVIVLTNTMSLNHLRENIEATQLKLAAEDIALIDQSYQPPLEIPVCDVKVEQQKIDDAHKVYCTLEEVLANADSIHPNPHIMAEEIKRNGLLKPIEVLQTNGGYQLIHGSQRYFAWIIAYGDRPIPAFVV